MSENPEFDLAVMLAHKALDRPYGDPDDDLSILARQFLRSVEREGGCEITPTYNWEALQRYKTSALDLVVNVAACECANLAAMLRRMIWMAEKEVGETSMKALAGKARALLISYGVEGNPLRDS